MNESLRLTRIEQFSAFIAPAPSEPPEGGTPSDRDARLNTFLNHNFFFGGMWNHVQLNGVKEDVRSLRSEVTRLTAERDAAVAHDRQPYPTAEAYEKVCAALAALRERNEALEAAATALIIKYNATPDFWKDRQNSPLEDEINALNDVLDRAATTGGKG